MPAFMVDILNKKQKEVFKKILEKTDGAMNVAELEGFLFGIALTPDVIFLSEYMPEIFGNEEPIFESQEEMSLFVDNLMKAYNAYIYAAENQKFKILVDVIKDEDLTDEYMAEISDWAKGLFSAFKMRPEIWYPDRELIKNDLEGLDSYVYFFGILYSAAYPDIVNKHLKNDKNVDRKLIYKIIPSAVEGIKAVGEMFLDERKKKFKENLNKTKKKKEKIGRNDLCPCGSGKKYKKCCGRN
ncbi:UPF0149 family protein [Deferribacteraceae bacterium V6Fe1]|nr:UPF0149 family protein [Deferribacteraceae bacterium V6Fe1]